jgi:hypothetical protein
MRVVTRARLFDPGGLQPRRVSTLRVGACVQRMDGGGGEGVGARLIKIQIDVREREPGAVSLATRIYRQRRIHHRSGRHLGGDSDILACRERLKGSLCSSVARADRRATTFCPREPLGVRPVLWRGDQPLDDWLALRLLRDHLP